MLRLLLALVIVGLGLAFVAKSLKQPPAQVDADALPRATVQEAERLKAELEENQIEIRDQFDRIRDE